MRLASGKRLPRPIYFRAHRQQDRPNLGWRFRCVSATPAALRIMALWSNCAKDISPVPPKAFWIESSSSPTIRACRVEIQNAPISRYPTAPLIVGSPRPALTGAM